MTKFVTEKQVRKMVREQVAACHNSVGLKKAKQVARDTLKLMQTDQVSYKEDNRYFLRIDVTWMNEIGVALKTPDNKWHCQWMPLAGVANDNIFALKDDQAKAMQGKAALQLFVSILTESFTEEEAEHIISVMRNPLVALFHIIIEPKDALDFVEEPFAMRQAAA